MTVTGKEYVIVILGILLFIVVMTALYQGRELKLTVHGVSLEVGPNLDKGSFPTLETQ